MSSMDREPRTSSPDLSFLKKMKTVREELGKLDQQELSSLPLEDRARKVKGVLEAARRSYLEKGWIDNVRQLEPVMSSLGRGEITPEKILQAVSDKKENTQSQSRGWRSLFRRG